jgi:hypothetical protein
MAIDNYLLSMSEAAQKLVELGQAYRQGGVVYTSAGKILEHLHDVDVVSNANTAVQSLVSVSVVPLAIFGASMMAINHRLGKIEEKLDALKEQVKAVISLLIIDGHKLDALLIGKLIGTIRGCQMDILEQRNHRLVDHRQTLIEEYHQLKTFVFAMARSKAELKTHVDVFSQYLRAMLLAGIAARDVIYRMGEYESAIAFSNELAKDGKELSDLVIGIIKLPASQFWVREPHFDVAIDVRESSDRLASHVMLLEKLPKKELQKLLCNQLAM